MTKEQIEQRFANAGWDLDGSFAEHLVIGYNGERISLLAEMKSFARLCPSPPSAPP